MNKIDELSKRRYLKSVMNYGIPRQMAIEIVDSAIDASNGGNIDFYIKYAISITYGLRLNNGVAIDKR